MEFDLVNGRAISRKKTRIQIGYIPLNQNRRMPCYDKVTELYCVLPASRLSAGKEDRLKHQPVKFTASRADLKLDTYKYTTEKFEGPELDLPADDVMLSILHEILSGSDKEMMIDDNDSGE